MEKNDILKSEIEHIDIKTFDSTPIIEAFEGMAPSRRREFLVWVLDAKRQETRERRIRRGIEVILEEWPKAGRRGKGEG